MTLPSVNKPPSYFGPYQINDYVRVKNAEIPSNAILDENSQPVLDENGNVIVEEQ